MTLHYIRSFAYDNPLVKDVLILAGRGSADFGFRIGIGGKAPGRLAQIRNPHIRHPRTCYPAAMSGSVSRGRPLDPGQHGILDDDLPAFEQGPLDLWQWFPRHRRDKPLELEIGSGKGTFLVEYARQALEVNLVGVEWAKAYWRYAADRCRRHELDNVFLVRAEAAMFLRQYVPDATFRQVHIYHPDPWPKARHHKRRLIQARFLKELHAKLQPAGGDDPQRGLVRITTDHPRYFEWIEQAAAEVSDWFDRLPFVSPLDTADDELVGTNFERKYRAEGRQFHGLILQRKQ
jgi:tRNA (guanine-N7-)-methyltransferase